MSLGGDESDRQQSKRMSLGGSDDNGGDEGDDDEGDDEGDEGDEGDEDDEDDESDDGDDGDSEDDGEDDGDSGNEDGSADEIDGNNGVRNRCAGTLREKWVREVLTGKKGQKPKHWIRFDDIHRQISMNIR